MLNSPLRLINIRLGLVGALIMGTVVFYINYDSDLEPALIAALKQAVYTFLFGGLIIKLCQNLSIRYSSKFKSILIASIIPTLMATAATYVVHQTKGTPKPIASTIPTVFISIPGFLLIGIRKRSGIIRGKTKTADSST